MEIRFIGSESEIHQFSVWLGMVYDIQFISGFYSVRGHKKENGEKRYRVYFLVRGGDEDGSQR